MNSQSTTTISFIHNYWLSIDSGKEETLFFQLSNHCEVQDSQTVNIHAVLVNSIDHKTIK